jgi:hypothetical protein
MSDTIGSEGTAHEAYAFACMSCGHGWEQAYEIHHHTDAQGRPFVTYQADGKRVDSPLTRPTCGNCEGHRVRIMRAGQVAEAITSWATHTRGSGTGAGAAAHRRARQARRAAHRGRHWPLLHRLHLGRGPRRAPEHGTEAGPEQGSGPGRGADHSAGEAPEARGEGGAGE